MAAVTVAWDEKLAVGYFVQGPTQNGGNNIARAGKQFIEFAKGPILSEGAERKDLRSRKKCKRTRFPNAKGKLLDIEMIMRYIIKYTCVLVCIRKSVKTECICRRG